MREHREKIERRKEEIRRLLAETRSDELILTEEPSLEAIPGLMEALEHFISPEACDEAGFHYKIWIFSIIKHTGIILS